MVCPEISAPLCPCLATVPCTHLTLVMSLSSLELQQPVKKTSIIFYCLSKSTDQAYKEAQEPRWLVALTVTTDGPIGPVIAASISPPGLWARRVTTKLSILIKLLIN